MKYNLSYYIYEGVFDKNYTITEIYHTLNLAMKTRLINYISFKKSRMINIERKRHIGGKLEEYKF